MIGIRTPTVSLSCNPCGFCLLYKINCSRKDSKDASDWPAGQRRSCRRWRGGKFPLLANSEPQHRLGQISSGVEKRAERNKTGLRTRRGSSTQILLRKGGASCLREQSFSSQKCKLPNAHGCEFTIQSPWSLERRLRG